jgi:hypothetical protein
LTLRTTNPFVLAGALVVLAGLGVIAVAAASVRVLVPMPATLPIAAGMGGVVLGALLGAVAGAPKNRVVRGLGLAMLLGMLGAAGTALGMRLVDVLLDGAPEQHHLCTVVVRRWEEERDVYVVALAGCPTFPGDPARVQLPSREFRLTSVGQPIVLVTKPGFLGYPHLLRVEAVPTR